MSKSSKHVAYDYTDAEKLYDAIFDLLCTQYKNLAVNVFEWKGLEEISPTLTSEIIENYLYDDGKSLFFDDKTKGYMALKVLLSGNKNVYGKDQRYQAVGFGYSKHYSPDNSVLIKNNDAMQPTKHYVEYYCSVLTDIEMTKKMRRDALKTPYVIECSADTELSAKNYYKKLRSFEPAIFKKKSMMENEVAVGVQNTDPQYINDKLDDEYNTTVAKLLTLLGINNYCEDKAERVQSAEVESNDEYIIANFRASLEARKKSCEAINKMFGLNLSVDFVKDEQIETDEEVEDEQIHSGTENDSK